MPVYVGRATRIFLGDVELPGVTDVNIEINVNSAISTTITMLRMPRVEHVGGHVELHIDPDDPIQRARPGDLRAIRIRLEGDDAESDDRPIA